MHRRGLVCIAGAIVVFVGARFLQSVPEIFVLDRPMVRPGEIAGFAFVAGAAMLAAGFIILVRGLRRRE